jgi:hypothetical protein
MMQFLLKIPRNLALFLALSSIFVVQPFVGVRSLVLNIIIALSILSSIYSLTRNRRQFVIASALGVPGLVIGLLAAICRERRNVDGLLPVDLYLGYVALGLFLAFFLYSVYGIAVSVFKQRRITADVLLGSICAYTSFRDGLRGDLCVLARGGCQASRGRSSGETRTGT